MTRECHVDDKGLHVQTTVEKIVGIIKELPQGLPSVSLPQVPITPYLAMVLPAIGVLLVAYRGQTGLLALIGEDHVFPTVDLAVRFVETKA